MIEYEVNELADEVRAYVRTNYPNRAFSQAHYKILHVFLTELARGRRKDTYGNYFPWLNFAELCNRTLAGHALGNFLTFCVDHYWPWFNFLVVTADTGLPGDGMVTWYCEQFGSLTGYERFCKLHAALAINAITPDDSGKQQILISV